MSSQSSDNYQTINPIARGSQNAVYLSSNGVTTYRPHLNNNTLSRSHNKSSPLMTEIKNIREDRPDVEFKALEQVAPNPFAITAHHYFVKSDEERRSENIDISIAELVSMRKSIEDHSIKISDMVSVSREDVCVRNHFYKERFIKYAKFHAELLSDIHFLEDCKANIRYKQ